MGGFRQSLIELILPFSEESKDVLNFDRKKPFQLTQINELQALLKPNVHTEDVVRNIDFNVNTNIY